MQTRTHKRTPRPGWRALALVATTLAAVQAPLRAQQLSPFGAAPERELPQATTSATLNAAGEGRRLYLKLNCYSCHGMRGAGGMGPRIVGTEEGDVREKMLQGEESGMRSYRGLVSSTDIHNIAVYLGTIGKKSEPKFTHWWEAQPSR